MIQDNLKKYSICFYLESFFENNDDPIFLS